MNPTTPDLPFTDPAPNPRDLAQHREALLAAFRGSTLWHPPLRYTLADALAVPALRRCLTTAAEIRARKQLEKTA